MFSHIVTFELHHDEDVAETAALLRSMAGRIESLKGLEVGVDEGRGPRSVHLVLITRFEDEAGYRAYAVHPAHKAVLEHMGRVTRSAAVVDWTG